MEMKIFFAVLFAAFMVQKSKNKEKMFYGHFFIFKPVFYFF
jgi:hypothetical protein